MGDRFNEELIKQEFLKVFFFKNCSAKMVENLFLSEWNSTLIKMDYIPVSYTISFLEYQKCYMRCFTNQLIDLSIIFYQNKKAVGVWPISLKVGDRICEYVTNEGSVLKPLFINGFSERSKKHIYDACFGALKSLDKFVNKERNAVSRKWIGQHLFLENSDDAWYKKCIEKANDNCLRHELYVDLSMNYDDIKKNIRKSFKSLINLGERLWLITIHDSITSEGFAEFRKLHCKVAGRETRSIETWELQKQAIDRKEAFLVTLRDRKNELIGVALFHISRDEGVYAVGAYNRELFDQPVSHVIQMRAIQHMKNLGVRWYRIGTRFYPSDKRDTTDKEYNISYFKEGFATNIFLNVLTECSLN